MAYRLLILEDSAPRRPALTEALRRVGPGWPLIETASADAALRAVALGEVDMALVDLGRPGADGLELAALMRRAQPNLPIGIISAQLQNENLIRAQRLRVAFIPKPVSDDALAAFLAQAAMRRRTEAG